MSQFNAADSLVNLTQFGGRIRRVPPILISTINKSGSTFLTNQIGDWLVIPQMKLFTSVGYHDSRLYPTLDQFEKGRAVCCQHFAL